MCRIYVCLLYRMCVGSGVKGDLVQLHTCSVCLHGTTQSREFAHIRDTGSKALVWDCSRSQKDLVIKQYKEQRQAALRAGQAGEHF